jgi:hypothetical protein
MSGARLSGATKALLQAARADGPTNLARAKVWSGVSSTVGGAVGAAGAAASGTAVGTSAGVAGWVTATKMLVAGTLLGGTAAVGLATALITLRPTPPDRTTHAPSTVVASTATARAKPTGVPPIEGPAPVELNGATTHAPPVTPTPVAMLLSLPTPPSTETIATAHPALRRSAPPAVVTRRAPPASENGSAEVAPRADRQAEASTRDDALTREASLVAEARSALARGDAAGALRAVRAARGSPSPQLVPEEMAVEAQALRALGQADQAKGVAETLKSQYPDSALAR